MVRRAALAALLLGAASGEASAQRIDRVAFAGPDTAVPAMTWRMPRSQPARRDERWWIPLASMAVPGAGQALLSQDRFVAYMAAEGFAWLRYRADAREGRRQRDAYRALALRVARRYYPDPRPVGDFEYYERMEHYIESGVFDQFPGGDIEPETDTLTFNGAMWLLARRTYWPDPDVPPPRESTAFDNAMIFYQGRAVTPEFRWSWRNAQLEQDLFRRTIARSNDAFRRSIQDLGLVIANHALSTVDAYVTLRLRHRTVPDEALEMSATVPWPSFGR